MVNILDVEKWKLDAFNYLLMEEDTKLVLIIKGSNVSLLSKFHRVWNAGISFALYWDFTSRPKALKRQKLDSEDTAILECTIIRKRKYSDFF